MVQKRKSDSDTNKEKLISEKGDNKNGIISIILFPTFFYFLIVAVASPWIEIRYMLPICNLLVILLIYWTYIIASDIFPEFIKNIVMGIVVIILMISPALYKIEPQSMYSDKKEFVNKLENELNLPTLYVYYSDNDRFLDDILLFSKINESYIAKDLECSVENIKTIFQEKDTSKGVIIFINKDEENEKILESIGNTLGLKNVEHMQRMNACNIYYLS